MRTLYSMGVGVLIIVVVGLVVFSQRQAVVAPALNEQPVTEGESPIATSTAETSKTTPAPANSPVTTTPKPAPLTLAVVATHATRTSCWTAINGTVYDLTSWIPQHPGGEAAILKLCGVDGSARYNAQHGGGKKQQAILTGFAVGPLAP